MKYLVTGGAGFIGSALVKRLLGDGHDVTVLARGATPRLQPVVPPAYVFHGDIRDPHDVLHAIHGCDAAIHLAYPQGRDGDPRELMDTAVRGTLNVLDACEKTGVGELLLISSPDVYGSDAPVPTPETAPLVVPNMLDPYCRYGAGKIASEALAVAWEQSGTLGRLVIARPFNIYGPDMGSVHVIPQFIARMAKSIAAGESDPIAFPIAGNGQESRAFCYISDCTDQLVTLLEHGASPGIYNVGATTEFSIASVAGLIAASFGRQIEIKPGPVPLSRPLRRVPEMSRTRTLCGYRDRIAMAEGIKRTTDWYRSRG